MFWLVILVLPLLGYYFYYGYYFPYRPPIRMIKTNNVNNHFRHDLNDLINRVTPLEGRRNTALGRRTNEDNRSSNKPEQFKLIPLQKLNDVEINPRNIWWRIWDFLGGTVWPATIDVTVQMMPNSLKDVLIKVFGKDFISLENISPVVKYIRSYLHRSSIDNYKRSFELMLQYEIDEEENELKKYNLDSVRLTREKDRQFFFPVTADMTELCNAFDENQLSQFILLSKNSGVFGKELKGRLVQRKDGKFYVEIYRTKQVSVEVEVDESETYSMIFQPIRKNFYLQKTALRFVDNHNLFGTLIKNSAYHLIGKQLTTFKMNYDLPESSKQTVKIVYYEMGSHSFDAPIFNYHPTELFRSLNDEQKSAVTNIVVGGHYPLPYLLYGPPGTGKTKTLTAAIEQIVRTTYKNILVCAMSNAACDEIAERLLGVLSNAEVHRLYTTSYNLDNISKTIRPACNIEKDDNDNEYKLYNPPLRTLYGYRVIICTLSTAGSLTKERADSSIYSPRHFQYVFIDECASSHETMTLIPIAGLCSSKNKVYANIILSGDPKQLPPVTKSKEAENLGFKTTWMEHLLEKSLYERDRATGIYNPKYITLLVQNYRSHEAILEIPNKLFYKNQLIKSAPESVTNLFLNSSILPAKHFPIVFKSVQGFCQRMEDDSSLFNNKEIDAVITSIRNLLEPSRQNNYSVIVNQSDIGVVTPYKKQCKKISQACRNNNWQHITVGTSEAFQGQEKAVMIVSTVRAGGKYLGFVNDPQRMNVIITRAKCLLIIIGDPFTLKLDKNWAALIKYCLDNKGLIQSNKKIVM